MRNPVRASAARCGAAMVAALWSVFACAATPLDGRQPRQQVTLDFLLEACTVIGETGYGMIPHFDCESYLYGVLEAHLAVRESLPMSRRACFPAAMAPWQVYELVVSEAPSDIGPQPAAAVVLDVLRSRFPCSRPD